MNSRSHPAKAIVLSGVHKSYRVDSVVTQVLHGVDLEIDGDGLSVLSGPSGSGKTTLLNLMGCIDRPDQGKLIVLGVDVGTLSDAALSDFRRRHIGFVFQNFNLLPVLTAYENVEYPLRLAGLVPARRKAMVQEALDQVALGALGKHYPSQLSGGQRQRVAIARALVKGPSLVLADEPTANLDSYTGASILALMKTLQERHRVAFVISSHDPQVHTHADRLFAIRDGALVPSAPRPQPAAEPRMLSIA